MQLDFFHNTIQAEPEEMKVLNEVAKSQEEQVHEVFLKENRPMAWFEVSWLLPHLNEVSLKRCLSNLSTDKKDKKTGEIVRRAKLVMVTDKSQMKLSPAKAPCHVYKIST